MCTAMFPRSFTLIDNPARKQKLEAQKLYVQLGFTQCMGVFLLTLIYAKACERYKTLILEFPWGPVVRNCVLFRTEPEAQGLIPGWGT